MKNIISVILVLILLGGCSDILEENPKSIASETFYNTADEVEASVNAIYDPLHQGGFTSYFTLLEGLSDNVYGKGSLATINDYQGFSTANITNMSDVWTTLYLSIRNANAVIKNTPSSSGTTEGQKRQFIAEAKFLRALDYFFLVRLWGGVPLRTEDTMNEISIARSSTTEVYDLILDDLEYAEESLPDEPRLLGTPSKWTAKTVLADVHLNLENWESARDKAIEVIESGKYSLVEINEPNEFEKIFGADVTNTTEEIFYFKYNRQRGSHLMNFFHISGSGYKPYGNNWYSFYSTKENHFYMNWNDNDFRKQYNFYSWDIGLGEDTFLFKKYTDPNGTNNAPNDWPIYRYAEVLLIAAEAANKANNGPTPDAIEYLNQVHRRAYGYSPNVSTPVDFILQDYDEDSFSDLVLRERGYEFILECKRWLDLVRTGKAAETIKEAEGINIDESMYLWAIPNSEINYNDAISPSDQNPGY